MDFSFYIGFLLFVVSLIAFALALGGTIYQHTVEYANWKKDIPHSLISYRAFFKHSNFGHFFKLVMPVSSIGLLAAFVLLWSQVANVNTWTLLAMAGLILTAGFTNLYFVPRHSKLLLGDLSQISTSELQTLARQWGNANRLRILLMCLTLLSFLKGFQVLCVMV